MNSFKDSKLFGLAVVPVLAAGLFLALQLNMDKDTTRNPLPPGTATPGDQEPGFPSIIPSDRDTTKIEYRNVLFRGNSGKAFGLAEESNAKNPAFLHTPDIRIINPMNL